MGDVAVPAALQCEKDLSHDRGRIRLGEGVPPAQSDRIEQLAPLVQWRDNVHVLSVLEDVEQLHDVRVPDRTECFYFVLHGLGGEQLTFWDALDRHAA